MTETSQDMPVGNSAVGLWEYPSFTPGKASRPAPEPRRSRQRASRIRKIALDRASKYSSKMRLDLSNIRRLLAEDDEMQSTLTLMSTRRGLSEEKVKQVIFDVLDHYETLAEPEIPFSLPEKPPELYIHRGIAPDGRRENIVQFLSRAWGPWIKASLLTRVDLRKFDSKADKAVDNWIQLNGQLPSELRIPTKKQVIDETIASNPEMAIYNPKLARVIASRHNRGLEIPQRKSAEMPEGKPRRLLDCGREATALCDVSTSEEPPRPRASQGYVGKDVLRR